MAIFPKIQSPCPYKGNLSAIMDGDVCRLCKRQVFDLTHMSDGERVAFMQGCSDQVCVTYRFPVRPAVAAAVLAAAAIVAPTAVAACDSTEMETVVVGGIKDPANVKYVQTPVDRSVPELPVVYDEGRDGAAADRAPARHRVSSRDAS
ncbi:MAG TPA: hypothetical protein VIM02_09710 [Rhizomicrobium sp.]|jgi:predicted Fe-S protein YdhL (DUF1289 family)